jgi:hypothetical protein
MNGSISVVIRDWFEAQKIFAACLVIGAALHSALYVTLCTCAHYCDAHVELSNIDMLNLKQWKCGYLA